MGGPVRTHLPRPQRHYARCARRSRGHGGGAGAARGEPVEHPRRRAPRPRRRRGGARGRWRRSWAGCPRRSCSPRAAPRATTWPSAAGAGGRAAAASWPGPGPRDLVARSSTRPCRRAGPSSAREGFEVTRLPVDARGADRPRRICSAALRRTTVLVTHRRRQPRARRRLSDRGELAALARARRALFSHRRRAGGRRKPVRGAVRGRRRR